MAREASESHHDSVMEALRLGLIVLSSATHLHRDKVDRQAQEQCHHSTTDILGVQPCSVFASTRRMRRESR